MRLLRLNSGLSQFEVSRALHLARKTISNYECGYREPDLATSIEIADFFQVSLDYLCGRTTQRQNSNVIQYPDVSPMQQRGLQRVAEKDKD